MLPLIDKITESENLSEDDRKNATQLEEIVNERAKVLVLAANEGWPFGEKVSAFKNSQDRSYIEINITCS